MMSAEYPVPSEEENNECQGNGTRCNNIVIIVGVAIFALGLAALIAGQVIERRKSMPTADETKHGSAERDIDVKKVVMVDLSVAAGVGLVTLSGCMVVALAVFLVVGATGDDRREHTEDGDGMDMKLLDADFTRSYG